MTSRLPLSNGGCWNGLNAFLQKPFLGNLGPANPIAPPKPPQTVGIEGLRPDQFSLFVSTLRVPSPESPKSVKEHIAAGDSIVAKLKNLAERAQQKTRHQREAAWLAANRHNYKGQWIALEGDQLLAAGHSAKAVFALVANCKTTPLVIFLAEEELPFAGW